MQYYLYARDKQWQLYKIFNNIDKLIHWCEYHYDYVH